MATYSSVPSLGARLSSAYQVAVHDPAALLPAAQTLQYALGGTVAVVLAAVILAHLCGTTLRTVVVFAYNCFLQPLGKTNNQGERLDRFYQNQAEGELLHSDEISIYNEPESSLILFILQSTMRPALACSAAARRC